MIVVRIDESTLAADGTTLYADLAFLVERGQQPIVVAPSTDAARTIVKTINRTSDSAVGVSGADAGMLPATGDTLGAVQTRLLHTLLSAGYIPVVEPLAFGMFGGDVAVRADDVASAVARSMAAQRALFFHENGGVIDSVTQACIGELTPAEALTLDPRFGYFVNHDLAEYHVPVHADIPAIDAIFVTELDDQSNPLKSKGIGELGICGAGASIANAVYNACGTRVRDYPITLDKLLSRLPAPA